MDIKWHYQIGDLPQVWDELCRKSNDEQVGLPSGAGPSVVNDDFGDEYGIFYAITGDGFSYKELKDYADFLNRELLLVKDVASVSIGDDQQQVITLEISRARMAEFGISLAQIINTLNMQNQVVSAGRVTIGEDDIRLSPKGEFTAVEDLGDLLIRAVDPDHQERGGSHRSD